MATIEPYKTIFISQPTGEGGKLIQNNFKILADLNEISTNKVQSLSGNLNSEIINRTNNDILLSTTINTEIENRIESNNNLMAMIIALGS